MPEFLLFETPPSNPGLAHPTTQTIELTKQQPDKAIQLGRGEGQVSCVSSPTSTNRKKEIGRVGLGSRRVVGNGQRALRIRDK